MKILRFNDERVGVLVDGKGVVDVSEAISYREEKGPQRVMQQVIEEWDATFRAQFESLAASGDGVPLESVTLLNPIPQPRKVLAAFANYLDTPERKPDDIPLEFFYKSPETVGPGGEVHLLDIAPVYVFQPEAEIAFVIGNHAKNVSIENAYDHIFGYCPFVDISARGMTRRTQFLPKGQDTFALVGPWITTRDEVGDPHTLNVKSWVNGGARQDYSTSAMARKIPEQLSWASRFLQLQGGDIITTGTYHVGLGPINDGDVFEIEIEKLGRTSWTIKSDGPRKDPEFRPGVTQIPNATPGFSRVD
ncbi:MAG: fumarylacetoacetate hydrolase family protein [Chloroflexi bacterium]|nr:fumarylacetoacetate hydrolase family protein [Chloroflexota bacterium]